MAVSLSCSARSCGVRKSRPAYLAGRSREVVVAFDHEPCKSGSPHDVRHFVCAPAGAKTSAPPTISTSMHLAMASLLSLRALFSKMAVEQLFSERHALE